MSSYFQQFLEILAAQIRASKAWETHIQDGEALA